MPVLPETVERQRPESRPFQYRLRTLSLGVVVAAVWLGLVLDPIIGPLILEVTLAPVAAVGLLLAAVLLGALGCGLFAVGGSAVRWFSQAGQWTEKEKGWDHMKDG